MVPEGWKITSLSNVCEGNLKTGPFGSQLHANEYVESGVPVLMPKDLLGCRANLNSAAKITIERANDLNQHALKSGDLLFSRRGDVSRFALVDENSEGSLCGTGCLRARPSKKHSPLFLSYFLQKNTVQKWLEQNAVGQTMPNMNTAILSELPIMVASSYIEECKIAEILSKWDRAIEVTGKLLGKSQQQKKALMQQLLTGKKRLDGFSEKWREDRLGNLVGKIYGGGTPSKGNSSFWGGDIPWVTVKDLVSAKIKGAKESINEAGLANSASNMVPKGVVIIATRMAVGKAVVSSCDVAINQDLKAILPSNFVISEFIHQWFLLNSSAIEKLGTGSTVKGVQISSIKALRMSVPQSLKEQKAIVYVLGNADIEIELLEDKLVCLHQEKKALMQQLLTGKRRVQVDGKALSKESVDA